MNPEPADTLPHPFRSLPGRWEMAEILDDAASVEDAELRRSHLAMARVNRYLGGTRSLLRHLKSLVRAVPRRRLTLLDVGVGAGRATERLARILARRGIDVRWTGVDRSGRVLRLALHHGPGSDASPLVRSDALSLPFPADSFDVVTSNLMLHHLDNEQVRTLLVEAARVARHGVIMSDLERHPLHYLGARILAATWWRQDRITRYDGPASVLRSFTRDELRELTMGLPFSRIQVRRHFPFRVVVDGRLR